MRDGNTPVLPCGMGQIVNDEHGRPCSFKCNRPDPHPPIGEHWYEERLLDEPHPRLTWVITTEIWEGPWMAGSQDSETPG
jgi:hypothetical protein